MIGISLLMIEVIPVVIGAISIVIGAISIVIGAILVVIEAITLRMGGGKSRRNRSDRGQFRCFLIDDA
jgi:hypothetical protein